MAKQTALSTHILRNTTGPARLRHSGGARGGHYVLPRGTTIAIQHHATQNGQLSIGIGGSKDSSGAFVPATKVSVKVKRDAAPEQTGQALVKALQKAGFKDAFAESKGESVLVKLVP